jgi:hypothetical protein
LKQTKAKGTVFVFVPIGLPAMGKTLFYESSFKPQMLKAYPEADIVDVSNDEFYKVARASLQT